MERFFEKIWYTKYSPFLIILLPISLIFFLITKARYAVYKNNILKRYKSNIPIIIVGNISVGGSGKTPFVIWLTKYLLKKDLRVGVVSSGYKSSSLKPLLVDKYSDPKTAGDEAVLIANQTNCNVASGGDRISATKLLSKRSLCDVIIHDDGLQHYKLERDYEITLIDNHKLFGNGFLLPAGPLRESKSRLQNTDIAAYSNSDDTNVYAIASVNQFVKNIMTDSIKNIEEFNSMKIHLVTGIASIDAIINTLKENKIEYMLHKYDDHYHYNGNELTFDDSYPVFITHKDYVKLTKINNKNIWIIEHIVKPNTLLIDKLNNDLSILLNYEN